ncbi:MAG: hypothetical protein ACJ71B_01510 [Nitrososphaera sp.]
MDLSSKVLVLPDFWQDRVKALQPGSLSPACSMSYSMVNEIAAKAGVQVSRPEKHWTRNRRIALLKKQKQRYFQVTTCYVCANEGKRFLYINPS